MIDPHPAASASFTRHGPRVPAGPLVLAVPHAGRDYPAALLAGARLPLERLQALEDRLVDRLVAPLIDGGATAVVAHRARAWIDLNRDPREIDLAMVAGVLPGPAPIATARLRGGLGLVPRRIGGREIHAGPLPAIDIAARIAGEHRPYHQAIADALAAARARFGVAILLDCHSMPPLRGGDGGPIARGVVGDLYGRSAAPRFADAVLRALRRAGCRPAHNRPYAGGHTIERHGCPANGIHAVQLELCRTRYLDAALREPGPGWGETVRLLARIAADLTAQAGADELPIAAE